MSCMISSNSKYASVPNDREDEEACLSNLGELRYIREIREGGMSNILLFSLNKDGCQSKVAVKTLFRKSLSKRELVHLRTEANILSNIDHENVIRIYGITKTEYGFGLVLEYLPNGSYSDFFRNFREIPGNANYEDEIASLKIRIIGEIVSAMEYLHRPRKFLSHPKEKSILHLDLKGDNVLLNQDLHAKICDFGLGMLSTLTKLRTGTTVHGGASGTSGYIAPERLRNVKCKPTTKCDVYSFGILQYEILTDLLPYPDFDANNLTLLAYYVAEKNFRPDVSKISSHFPIELLHLMEQCWSSLPDSRPPFSEISNRMDAVMGQIHDFDRKASYSVNRVMTIFANEKLSSRSTLAIDSLPDVQSFSRIEPANGESYDTTTTQHDIEHPEILTSLKSETLVKNAVPSSTGGMLEYEHIRDLPEAESYCQQPEYSSTTVKKLPVSVGQQAYVEARAPDSDNDEDPLFPVSYDFIGATVTEKFTCSSAKILLTFLVAMVLAALIAMCVLIPLLHIFDDKTGGRCPPMKTPDHGNKTCEPDRNDSFTKCHFTCDPGYGLVGTDSSVCVGGIWMNKEPTCAIVCKSPQITDGIMNCTNHMFEGSICIFLCQNHHVIQGKSEISCLANGNWSDPVPSCKCPNCKIGDHCEYSISWQDVDDRLSAMSAYGNITVNYGGQVFACWTELHSLLKSNWIGICEGSRIKTKCGKDDFHAPATAAKASAATYIRQLVTQKKFPKPCDSEKMPTKC